MEKYSIRIDDGEGLDIKFRETYYIDVEAESPELAAEVAFREAQLYGGAVSDSIRIRVYEGGRAGGVSDEPVLVDKIVDEDGVER